LARYSTVRFNLILLSLVMLDYQVKGKCF